VLLIFPEIGRENTRASLATGVAETARAIRERQT